MGNGGSVHINDVRQRLDAAIVVEGLGLGLELVDDAPGLYPRLLLHRLLVPEIFLSLRLFQRLVAMAITGHVGRSFATRPTKSIGLLAQHTG